MRNMIPLLRVQTCLRGEILYHPLPALKNGKREDYCKIASTIPSVDADAATSNAFEDAYRIISGEC